MVSRRYHRVTCLVCPTPRPQSFHNLFRVSMGNIRGTGQLCPFRHACTTNLIYGLILSWAGHLYSPSWAIAECGVTRATPIRVQNQTGVGILRAAANCTGDGLLEADWTGAITLDSPIVIASGMFLSITGEDTLAEVRGGSQTKMFEVSRGGGLTLTQLKLSGGTGRSGGAVYSSSSDLVLNSCVFHGNVATNGSGGAVWANGGNLTIVGGEFTGNNASRGYGGAVAFTSAVGRLVVQGGSAFYGNTAFVGGALYCSGVAESNSTTSCSLSDTEFTSNTATCATEETSDYYEFADGVEGGGAVAVLLATADVTDSVFVGNHAQHSGGALLGGNGTEVTINRCSFENNTAEVFGGAIVAASATLGGGTKLVNNTATASGGAVLGWDSNGTIVFNDVGCSQNSAVNSGGCLYSTGTGIVNIGTAMHDNEAQNGGCIYVDKDSEMNVHGGAFSTCRTDKSGAFLYAERGTSVNITGGVIESNVAESRGGAMYCRGDEGSITLLTIEGGIFRNNTAWEAAGVIAARGSLTVVEIAGGVFINNTAGFYGGFVFLDMTASLKCENATIQDNYAGDQGGGIYSRSSTFVDSSCDLIGNQSPQGAALYLTGVTSATLKNHIVTDDLAFSGSIVYITESSIIATGVTFKSSAEDSTNRAVQSGSTSVVTLNGCVFDGWRGDTVIYHRNPSPGSLVLDSCDFSESSASTAVVSLNSDARIRNSVVGDYTSANAGTTSSSTKLVNRAVDCSEANVCGPGRCVNSTLGVLCECLDDETCLGDDGEVSICVSSPPNTETYHPDPVHFDLLVSSAGNATTNVIWHLKFEAEHLNLDVAPSSGMLPPGGDVTVAVTGTSTGQRMGGNLLSSFNLTSVGSARPGATAGYILEVESSFHLCDAYEYALPSGDETDGVSCQQCMDITGDEGVNCDRSGATLASLSIKKGYWRRSQYSQVVHECFHFGACVGATEVSVADDYCEDGYTGPYCAVCSEGYRPGVSNTCHSCDNTEARLLIWTGVIPFMGLLLLLVIVAVVFLIGGFDAVDIVRKSVTKKLPMARKASKVWSVSQASGRKRRHPENGAFNDVPNVVVAPAFDFTWESQPSARELDAGHSSGKSPPQADAGRAHVRPSGDVIGAGTIVVLPDAPARHAIGGRMPATPHARRSAVAGVGVDEVRVNRTDDGRGKAKRGGLGERIKRGASRLPLNKLKILIVVWQILTLFSSITEVEFPAPYCTFLSWISFVNMDIGHIVSVSCFLPSVNFYERLLLTTLTPLVLAAGLVLTYQMARRRAGIGSAGTIARRAAWSRHVAAGLLLTFLVFTSASTLVFDAFSCDDDVGDGEIYLRADYSLSCESNAHTVFKGYAMLMILVYPIGIPLLYATILWNSRELLNPRIHIAVNSEAGGVHQASTRLGFAEGAGIVSSLFHTSSTSQPRNELTSQELQAFNETVNARRDHPDLVPSMFLWKDFGPDFFYYEVIECGRRMLLTGVLIFVAPHSSTQVATACIFAFGSLLGFELMRPYLDPTDAWLYRLGCMVIFMSNFLALLIKVDVAEEGKRSALGGLLVAVNVLLVLAVLFTSWFAVQQSVDDSRDDESTFLTVARAMVTTEQDAANSSRTTRERSTTTTLSRFYVGRDSSWRGSPTV